MTILLDKDKFYDGFNGKMNGIFVIIGQNSYFDSIY